MRTVCSHHHHSVTNSLPPPPPPTCARERLSCSAESLAILFTTSSQNGCAGLYTLQPPFFPSLRSRKMPKKLPFLSKTQGEPHASSSKLSASSSEPPASSAKLPAASSELPASGHDTEVKRSERFPESVVDEVAECRDGGTASDDRKRARELQSRCHHKEIPGCNSNFLKRMKSSTRKACERCRERKTSCDENSPCGKCVKSFQHIQAMGELSLFSFRTPEEMCFRSARKQAQRTSRKPSNETSITPN